MKKPLAFNYADYIALQAENERLKADLRHVDNCDICKHNTEVPGCEFECSDCKLDCACKHCQNEDKWEWRGLKGETDER